MNKTKPRVNKCLKIFDIADFISKWTNNIIIVLVVSGLWVGYEYLLYSQWRVTTLDKFYEAKEREYNEIQNKADENCPHLNGIIMIIEKLPNPEFDLIIVQVYDVQMINKLYLADFSVPHTIGYHVGQQIMVWPSCNLYGDLDSPYFLNVTKVNIAKGLIDHNAKFSEDNTPSYENDHLISQFRFIFAVGSMATALIFLMIEFIKIAIERCRQGYKQRIKDRWIESEDLGENGWHQF